MAIDPRYPLAVSPSGRRDVALTTPRNRRPLFCTIGV